METIEEIMNRTGKTVKELSELSGISTQVLGIWKRNGLPKSVRMYFKLINKTRWKP